MNWRNQARSVAIILAAIALVPCSSEGSQAQQACEGANGQSSLRIGDGLEVRPLRETTQPLWGERDAVLFHEDFESGAPGWTTEGQIVGEPGSLWHVESRRSVAGNYSMAYNTGEPDYNYDVGQNWGRVMSPPIDIYYVPCPRVVVSSWLQTENAPGDDDMAFIQVSCEGGGWWYILNDIQLWPQSQWVVISADLPHSGGVPGFRVGFWLMSQDGEDDDYEGWYIDEVWIIDVAVPVESASWGRIKALYRMQQ